MTDVRVSHVSVESVLQTDRDIRVSHVSMESTLLPDRDVRVSHVYVETIYNLTVTTIEGLGLQV
jgi:hypothetical protein